MNEPTPAPPRRPPASPAAPPPPTSTGSDVPDRHPVLVVGVTGKTGRAVAAALVRHRVRVRGTVRPGHTGPLPPGVEAVEVDLDTGTGLEAALASVAQQHPDVPIYKGAYTVSAWVAGLSLDARFGD